MDRSPTKTLRSILKRAGDEFSRFSEIGGFRAFGEPFIGRGEDPESITWHSARMQETAQAHCGAQFEGPRSLFIRDLESLAKICFGFILRRAAAELENQGATKAIEFRLIEITPAFAQ